MRIVLLGAPGSGKGTQCKHIAERYGLPHLSSGDILRRESSNGTELGKKAQDYMDSGALVPDELMVQIMMKAISEAMESGFVLDGFPRTVNQAVELDKLLAHRHQKIEAVLNLNVDDEIVTQRITGRRSCPECGAVYHAEKMRPRVEGICDNDGAELVHRPDDTVEVVVNRVENYHQQTEPVVDYYKNNSTVYDIDANKDAEDVKDSVFGKLNVLA